MHTERAGRQEFTRLVDGRLIDDDGRDSRYCAPDFAPVSSRLGRPSGSQDGGGWRRSRYARSRNPEGRLQRQTDRQILLPHLVGMVQVSTWAVLRGNCTISTPHPGPCSRSKSITTHLPTWHWAAKQAQAATI